MTNISAIVIYCIVILAFILDAVFNAGVATLFVLKKAADLSEWLAIWR